jgi:hypothetical protein
MSQRRTLTEAFSTGSPDEPALRVDADAGVIHGVKVLGRFSRNSHGAPGAANGTEYTVDAMRKAVPLYEGADVMIDHPDRDPAGKRSSRDVFGKLRNVRLEGEELRADLHYFKTDAMAPKVVEDVTRRLGSFGLSHNVASGRERIDRTAGRLIVESIDLVRSVDLVRKPATNRNLWESDMTPETKPLLKTTLRELLESQGKRWSKNRKLWADCLLEMDGMDGPIAAPVEVEANVEPDDALWSGFEAAIMACLDKYEAGEYDSTACVAKIKDLLKTHEKLDSDADPEAPEAETDDDTETETDKTESVKPDAEKAELARFRREKQVRDLCESCEFTPTKPVFAALVALETAADRKALIEESKAAATKPGVRPPRSGRSLTESQKPDPKADAAAVADRLARLRSR